MFPKITLYIIYVKIIVKRNAFLKVVDNTNSNLDNQLKTLKLRKVYIHLKLHNELKSTKVYFEDYIKNYLFRKII